jgi:hypothetical protein
MRFLIRHWRGELPLAQALWLNGVALTTVILGFSHLSIFGRWQSMPDSYPDIAALSAFSIIFLIIIPTWQLRGIWKAADHHIDHVGTILAGRGAQTVATLLTLLAVIRVAGVVGDVALMAPIALNTGIYRSNIVVQKNGREMVILGGFGFGLSGRMADMLAEHPAIRRVRLESWGGSFTEAIKLAELIERHKLNTYTGRRCINTCVIPFISGRHRTLKGPGRLAFTDVYGMPRSAAVHFRQRGITQRFLKSWEQFNPRTWYPTNRELYFGGVVETILENPGR